MTQERYPQSTYGRTRQADSPVIDVRDLVLHEVGWVTLADKRRGRSNDSFGTRDVHEFEEKPGADLAGKRVFNQKYNLQVLNYPLHDTKIVHHLYKCNEKNNGGELGTKRINHS